MEKKWNIKPKMEIADVDGVSQKLQLPPVISMLLMQRGITTYEEAKTFFHPKLTDMHNPFLMKDMDLAVERINRAASRGEKLLIYGDYDVDGTTSVALVYSFLKKHLGADKLDFYIPNRYTEGCGISYEGIDYAKEKGISLVVALDCGIKAVEKVGYAKSLGIDFIICDHHTPDETLPDAVACLDARREDCSYPDKNLSGCGVGFKLMQAFCRVNNYKEQELLEYLDLLVVSIASDIVPMIGENRVLAYHGLKKLNENPSVGMQAIIKLTGLDKKSISISDIVFKIGPRINAAGRMNTGNDAVRLLISDNMESAEKICLDIDASNEERKGLDRTITKEAKARIAANNRFKEEKTIVLFNEKWHKGVIGIVASRLTEIYYKPTVILTKSGEYASGSARSVEGYDLYKAIEACSNLLENFGGHTYAVGLTMKVENVEEFKRRFENYVRETIVPEQTQPQIDVDAELHLSSITPKFYRLLSQFEPFGPGNTRPVFISNDVFDYGTSKPIGKGRRHLKLELIEMHNRETMSGMAFGMGYKWDAVKGGNPFKICYSIEENEYKGVKTLQLAILDIHG
jgi:single-stranded-DNA-specific exonuclease